MHSAAKHIFPIKESAQRTFDLLATPEQHKKLVRYDAGHINFPWNQVATEVTNWMDSYMGPVR